jgi:hypothetical protein
MLTHVICDLKKKWGLKWWKIGHEHKVGITSLSLLIVLVFGYKGFLILNMFPLFVCLWRKQTCVPYALYISHLREAYINFFTYYCPPMYLSSQIILCTCIIYMWICCIFGITVCENHYEFYHYIYTLGSSLCRISNRVSRCW